MKKQVLFIFSTAILLLTGCFEQQELSREEQCLRTPCTDSLCLIWAKDLNRCGTPQALEAERQRQKPIQTEEDKVDLKFKLHLRKLERKIDSLQKMNPELLAKKMIEDEFNVIQANHQTILDSIDMLKQRNGSDVTALQWLEYEKIIIKSKYDSTIASFYEI